MNLIAINKNQLDTFVKSQKQSQFLQSSLWGEFQATTGAKFFHYGLEDNDKIIFAFSVIEKSLPMGMKYFYSPRVYLEILNDEQRGLVFDEFASIAKERCATFWRIEPIKCLKIKNYKLKIIRTMDVQASKTNILDINKTEQELLSGMHQKTRYNIRLAAKKGVQVRVGGAKDFEKFWEIMIETRERDGFRLHGKEHYRKMLELDFIELIVAEFEGEIISANIVSFFGDMASYIHGSSSDRQRQVMAPFAIQWFSILRAKEKDCQYYDFNGIDEAKWPGVTRFKHGFGGSDVVYPGAFDIIFDSKKYSLYQLTRGMRRLIGKYLKI